MSKHIQHDISGSCSRSWAIYRYPEQERRGDGSDEIVEQLRKWQLRIQELRRLMAFLRLLSLLLEML